MGKAGAGAKNGKNPTGKVDGGGDAPDATGAVDEFYRVPLTSGEALAVLAAVGAVSRLTAPGPASVDTDLEPGILPSALARFTDELPEFLVARAERLAAAVELALREELGADGAASGLHDDGDRTEPPFPIGRTRRLLEDAFGRRVPAEIEYYVRSRREWTTRRVEIVDVFEEGGAWKMSGHCEMRGDFRQFKLDHIRTVRVLDAEDDEDTAGLRDPFAEE